MEKPKKSAPAIFMHSMIGLTAGVAAVCLFLYYSGIFSDSIALWIGIVAFMIFYHLGLRVVAGSVSKLFHINYRHPWFRERQFEKKLYRLLRVKKWKGKALTYQPEHFSLKEYSLDQIANTMAKSEVDHWINMVISLSSILFSLIWGELWIFVLTAAASMLFDAQFILIQRYNRPRVLRLLKKNSASVV